MVDLVCQQAKRRLLVRRVFTSVSSRVLVRHGDDVAVFLGVVVEDLDRTARVHLSANDDGPGASSG